jgi:hypothetical protein
LRVGLEFAQYFMSVNTDAVQLSRPLLDADRSAKHSVADDPLGARADVED